MIGDRAKRERLEALNVPVGLPPFELVLWFRDFFMGKYPYPQPEFDIISGIFFGYPLRDILIYADDYARQGKAQGHSVSLFGETAAKEGFLGWVVVGKDLATEAELDNLRSYAALAVENYKAEVSARVSATNIIKNWTPGRPKVKCAQLLSAPQT